MTSMFETVELSVTHLTAEAINGLNLAATGRPRPADGWPGLVCADRFFAQGWIVPTGSEEATRDTSVPLALRDCYRYARGRGADFIVFSNSRGAVPELAEYHWDEELSFPHTSKLRPTPRDRP